MRHKYVESLTSARQFGELAEADAEANDNEESSDDRVKSAEADDPGVEGRRETAAKPLARIAAVRTSAALFEIERDEPSHLEFEGVRSLL